MTARSLKAAFFAGVAIAFAAAPAGAQQDNGRIQRLEQQVKELRSIVFQGRDTGQPVIVKPAGPDPDVVALSAKIDQQTETIRGLTGQIETLQHDLDEARRTSEQLKADEASRRADVDARLQRLEGGAVPAAAPGAPAAATSPGASADAGPPPAPNSRAARSAALTSQAYASDGSQFGGGAPPAAAAAAAAAGPVTFEGAYQRLTAADYPGAQAGFEGWLTANPSSPRAPEARYYVGQAMFMREDYADAARSYAVALKGWPHSKWAPEATVKLAQSLQQLNVGDKACAALSEFDRRYAASAPAATRTRARTLRAAAHCG